MSKFSNRLTTIVIVILSVSLAVGVVLLRKQRTSQEDNLATVDVVPWALHSVTIQNGWLSREFLALATLKGSKTITVSSQISGEIESMGPREGLAVKKGEQIAKIFVRELIQQRASLRAELNAAQAEVTRTQEEFHRQQQLTEKRLTTQELLDSKKTAFIAAQNQVKNIQRQIAAQNVRIGYGTVYAPANAIVAARLSEPGDIAMPGKSLYELTVDTSSRLQVKLPQQVLEQVHSKTNVILTSGSHQETVQLSRIFPALDSHALGTAEADLDKMPFGLPSGARIPAQVILESINNALIIPHQAIVETSTQGNNKGFVFKVVGKVGQQHLQRLNVKIVLNAHKALAISSDDLHEGDEVIVAHESVLVQLKDNDPVIATSNNI